MRAIAVKEFRELRRDRRTLAMLFLLPFLFLVVFGYAASFDIKDVPTVIVGPGAQAVAAALPATFDVVATDAGADKAAAQDELRRGAAVIAVVTPAAGGGAATVLIDGTELFAAQAALRSLAELRAAGTTGAAGRLPLGGAASSVKVSVLYNPDLR
ncbi:MAG TPA: hypothetical protein VIK03_11495, partial [Thermoleophilia bacterium]